MRDRDRAIGDFEQLGFSVVLDHGMSIAPTLAWSLHV
jgi:hypothetical protein